LRQEIVVSVISLFVGAAGCVVGLRWGLVGVAWSVVLSQALSFVLMYAFAYRTISTRLSELGQALAPALILSALLCLALAALHWFIADLAQRSPFAYLALVGAVGGAVYGGAFLFLPMRALEGEAARWRARLSAAGRKAKFWSR
jgi:O-antigen/teichoic acid export membrane protein